MYLCAHHKAFGTSQRIFIKIQIGKNLSGLFSTYSFANTNGLWYEMQSFSACILRINRTNSMLIPWKATRRLEQKL